MLQGSNASGGYNSAYQWQYSYDGIHYNVVPGVATNTNYTPAFNVTQTVHFRRAWVSSCDTLYSNVITFNLHTAVHDTIRETVCEGSSYTGHGFSISEMETQDVTSLQRTHTGNTIYGCDSTTTLILTILPVSRDTLYATVCQGESYTSNGFNLANTTPGTSIETLTLTNAAGCDSILYLILTVHPVYHDTLYAEMCEGDAYDLLGFNITPEETLDRDQLIITHSWQSIHGCDSTFTLHMTIIDTSTRIITTQDYCEELYTDVHVQTSMSYYTWSNGSEDPVLHITQPGIYTVTAYEGSCMATASVNIELCDNTITLPNAITPNNNDGLNDYFCIPAYNQQLMGNDFEIVIYNRFGEAIYASHNKDFRWYGDFRGRTLHNETVNYMISYTDYYGNKKVLKGSIVVL